MQGKASREPKAPMSTLQRVTVFVQLLFVSVVAARLMIERIFPSLEILTLLLIMALMWRAAHRRLLMALMPFLLLLISYQILRGFADEMTHADIHITDLIAWEKALFGGVVPAAYLQAQIPAGLWQGTVDVATNAVYLTHFVTPIILAIILWYAHRVVLALPVWAGAVVIHGLCHLSALSSRPTLVGDPLWLSTRSTGHVGAICNAVCRRDRGAKPCGRHALATLRLAGLLFGTRREGVG